MPETGEITLFTKTNYEGRELIVHALIEDTVQIITLTNTIRIRSMKIDARLYVQFFNNESEFKWFMYDKWRYSGDYPTTSAHFDLYYNYGGTGLIRVTFKRSSTIPKIFPSLKNFVLKNIYTDSDSMISYNLNSDNTNSSSYDLGTSYNLEPDLTETTYTSPDITDTSDDLSNNDTDNTEIENAIIDVLNNVNDHNKLNLSDTLNSESINVEQKNAKENENENEIKINYLFFFKIIMILLCIIVIVVLITMFV